jgi:uncharacterized protein
MEAETVNIADVTREVRELLAQDVSGHGMEHIERVLQLAMAFADSESADKDIVTLAVLLHDVDDYKLFGKDNADNLVNATRILDRYNVTAATKETVFTIIRSMGYNKYLEGIRPTTLEGMIVSDADMCDAIGAIGIIRTHAYALSKGNEFFDKTLAPETASFSADQYRAVKKSHSVQHFFDKLLKIPSLLMTESGKKEGAKRQEIMVAFLRELFEEEGAVAWTEYLDDFTRS